MQTPSKPLSKKQPSTASGLKRTGTMASLLNRSVLKPDTPKQSQLLNKSLTSPSYGLKK